MSLNIYLTLRCPECGHDFAYERSVHDQNITHNLNRMAEEAGIYQMLWHPTEAGITKAEQLVSPLRAAIADMKAYPARFKKHNASNGWGMYEHFLPWLEELLRACEEHPNCGVRASI